MDSHWVRWPHPSASKTLYRSPPSSLVWPPHPPPSAFLLFFFSRASVPVGTENFFPSALSTESSHGQQIHQASEERKGRSSTQEGTGKSLGDGRCGREGILRNGSANREDRGRRRWRKLKNLQSHRLKRPRASSEKNQSLRRRVIIDFGSASLACSDWINSMLFWVTQWNVEVTSKALVNKKGLNVDFRLFHCEILPLFLDLHEYRPLLSLWLVW